MAPKEFEIVGLFGSSAPTALLDERPRKKARSKTAALQTPKGMDPLQSTQERSKNLVGELSSKKINGQNFLRGAPGDSKSGIDKCVIESKSPSEKGGNEVERVSHHISVRNLPPEQRKAYFAQKKRESNKRILATEEGKKKRNEAMRPINKKYYNSIMADPEKRSTYKKRSALNEEARQGRKHPSRPKTPSSNVSKQPVPV